MLNRFRPRAHCSQRRRGVVALELGLVLPIFLIIVFAIVELGRALMVQQIITNGAREGARLAVIPGTTDQQVYDAIDNYLAGTTVQGQTRTITPSLTTAPSHAALTVHVSVPYGDNSFGILSWLNGATLDAKVVMRKEL